MKGISFFCRGFTIQHFIYILAMFQLSFLIEKFTPIEAGAENNEE